MRNIQVTGSASWELILPALLPLAAENVLVALWLCLEAHSLQTPDLGVKVDADGLVQLTVTTKSREQAVILFNEFVKMWSQPDRREMALCGDPVGKH
jgi:hypothetical protein